MIRCKDIANALSDKNFRDMTNRQRFFLLLHVILCPVCGKFHRDVVKAHKNAREFSQKDELNDCCLSLDAKNRMQEEINKRKT